MVVNQQDVEEVEDLLRRQEGFDHLRVNKRGDSITLYSGDGPNRQQHARLTHLEPTTWGLSFPRHTGRWERTPLIGSLEELVTTLVRDFSFHLELW